MGAETKGSNINDKKLVMKVKSNKLVFDAVYEKYFNHIYKYCLIRIGSVPDAEDLTAQIFEEAFKGFDNYVWQNKPVIAWLYGIARYEVADHFKLKNKNATIQLAENIANPSNTTEKFENKDWARSIIGHITKFPIINQQILLLKLDEQMSFKEISIIVGKSETSCKVIAFRMIKKLRKIALREEDYHDK